MDKISSRMNVFNNRRKNVKADVFLESHFKLRPVKHFSMEKETVNLIDGIFKTALTVYDFQDSQVLTNRINDLTTSLETLSKETSSIKIPPALIDAVADGVNPDLYSSHLYQSLVDKNQKLAGRVYWITRFKDELKGLIQVEFPDLL